MKKINWGIIGLGNIANIFSEAFLNVNNAKLLSIASQNSKKLENFRAKYNIDKVFSFNNYSKLLKCKEIDIVYISLPHVFHYDLIVKSFENNKNVLVEKPAFINLNQANFLSEFKKKNLFFTEGFMYRYLPQTQKIISIIKNGEIGKINSMESSFGLNLLKKKKFFFFNKRKKIDPNNRLFNKELAGGCILDLGCYTSSFSLLIASILENINHKNFNILNVKKEMGETKIDIESDAVISFEGGFKSKIKSSFKNNIGSKSIIYGSEGKIILNNTWHGGSIKKEVKNKTYEIKENNIKNIYSYQIESVSQSLLDGLVQPYFPGTSAEETLLNTKILEEWLNV